MSEIENYKDLRAWQAARRLVREVYNVSNHFPREETFGLQQQIRRAAVSVPSNIAEGYGRASRDDYIRFLRMSRGSMYEVETQMVLACDLEYVSPESLTPFRNLFNESIALLQALIKSLTSK